MDLLLVYHRVLYQRLLIDYRVNHIYIYIILRIIYGLAGANPTVNTPQPSRGTRIESCDFIVLIGAR